MNELAQLPTPTIATRTLPSSTRCPLVLASCWRGPLSVICVPSPPRGWSGAPTTPLSCPGYISCPAGHLQGLELPTHMPHPLADREGGQRGHSVDGRRQELNIEHSCSFREDKADREQ